MVPDARERRAMSDDTPEIRLKALGLQRMIADAVYWDMLGKERPKWSGTVEEYATREKSNIAWELGWICGDCSKEFNCPDNEIPTCPDCYWSYIHGPRPED